MSIQRAGGPPEAIDVAALAALPSGLGPLNAEQHAAVVTIDGPMLILAGAGSGKTRVLTRRIAYLLQREVDPESILAMTFTNKAAGEMKERVAELVGGRADKVWVNTFHSACVRILRKDAEVLGYTRRFSIYDDDDQMRIIRQAIRDLGYDPKEVKPRTILSSIDRFKNRSLRREDVLAEQRARPGEPLMRVWEQYDEVLSIADALDFNDLIGAVVRLFTEHPEVLDRWRSRFHYVLVDEYQDTNHSQYQLLRLLTGEHHNLAVVGDDDQSIYGFRGADIRNIRDFESDHPDATIIRMEQNYRCSKAILALSNAVVAKAEQRIDKTLWTAREGGDKVRFLAFDDAREEARAIAALIRRMADNEGRPWRDFAVIYRTNAMSQPFELAFSEAGIPAKVVGGRRFYARREVRDALAWMRLLVSPADDAAFLRIVNVPPRGIGPATVKDLRDKATDRGDALLKTARALATGQGRSAAKLAAFIQLVDDLMEISVQVSTPELVREALVRSGYLTMLDDDGGQEAEDRRDNLQTLLQDAAQFVPEDPMATPLERLGAWLDRIALSGADEEIPEHGEVVLTTVHTAKGLEYPIVFVVHMAEGRFPHQRALEDAGGVDEERRLAYVAFTRAEERLFVSRIRQETPLRRRGERGPPKPPSPLAPSRFLFGAPKDHCAGDLPELEHARPRPADAGSVRRDAVADARRNLVRFLRGQPVRAVPDEDEAEAPSPPPAMHTLDPEPPQTHAGDEETVRTRPITSLEDVRPGTIVTHDRAGRGRVLEVLPPNVIVEVSTGIASFSLQDPRLSLVVD